MISIPLMRKALDALEANRKIFVHYTTYNRVHKHTISGLGHLCRMCEDPEMRVTDITVVKTDKDLAQGLLVECVESGKLPEFFINLVKRIRAGEFN